MSFSWIDSDTAYGIRIIYLSADSIESRNSETFSILTSSARKTGRPTIEGNIAAGKFCPAYPTWYMSSHEKEVWRKKVLLNLLSQNQSHYHKQDMAIENIKMRAEWRNQKERTISPNPVIVKYFLKSYGNSIINSDDYFDQQQGRTFCTLVRGLYGKLECENCLSDCTSSLLN